MKWAHRSSVDGCCGFFFLSHKAMSKLQSWRGVAASKEGENLILLLFLIVCGINDVLPLASLGVSA